MSFDLAVWSENRLITTEQAQAKYERICAGAVPAGSPELTDFVAQLTQRYPQIDDVNEDELDECPWSCEFDLSEGHCIMNLRWDAVESVVPEIVALARAHRLVCYDPQNEQILFQPTQ
jgi:hypothetical protein